jgi:undecaprenyl pyrophosphate phosphatase UppP
VGVVQGVTELLPISSDGHLALAHLRVGAAENDLVFDVVAHLGTLLAILLLLRGRSAELTRAGLAFLGRSDPDPEIAMHPRWLRRIGVASTPVSTGLCRGPNPAVAVSLLSRQPVVPLLAGFAAALMTGIEALKLLQWTVVTRRLLPFSSDCAVLGVAPFLFGITRG